MHEEVKVKELREEVGRGKKALDGVRVAALVCTLTVERGAQHTNASQHESKRAQTRVDKAQAQLMKLSNEAGASSRMHGLVVLNPVHPGRGVPVAVGLPSHGWCQYQLICIAQSVPPA